MGTLDKKDSNDVTIPVDDNAICIYKMDGGCVGTMTASWTYYGSEDNSTTIYGTEGIMHLYENPEYSIVIEKRDGTNIFYKKENIQTNSNQTKSGIIDLWLTCLKEQKEPEISGKEVLHSMKVVFAAEEAAMTGKTVLVE
jgi:predicted dehydrogenase